jgi:hypothetical protein
LGSRKCRRKGYHSCQGADIASARSLVKGTQRYKVYEIYRNALVFLSCDNCHHRVVPVFNNHKKQYLFKYNLEIAFVKLPIELVRFVIPATRKKPEESKRRTE